MANLNEKTKFICGRNPLAKNNRPPFAHPEQQKAALWLTEGAVNAQRSGKAISPVRAPLCWQSRAQR